jgi:DNA-binding LacI/PurR family transcriptional regulator
LRVINGDPLVAREACARVEAATSEPGCQSNAIAHSLAAGRTHTLARLAPNLTDYTFARISEGAAAGCRQHGFSLISSSAPGAATIDHSPIHGTKIDEGRWSAQR